MLGLSDMVVDVFLPWSDVSAGTSDMVFGCVPPMVRCGCWACLSDMVVGCVPPMARCKC